MMRGRDKRSIGRPESRANITGWIDDPAPDCIVILCQDSARAAGRFELHGILYETGPEPTYQGARDSLDRLARDRGIPPSLVRSPTIIRVGRSRFDKMMEV